MSKIRPLFDTFKLSNSLSKKEGANFSEETASKISELVNSIMCPQMDHLKETYVKQSDFERETGNHDLKVSKIKGNLHLRQTQSYQSSKLVLEQLHRELREIKQRNKEKMGSLKSEIRLDISLERSKQRDMLITNELKFQDLNNKIDKEIGDSKTYITKLGHDSLNTTYGTVFGALAVLFAFWRLII